MLGECIPACAADPAIAALSLQLIRALYEGASLSVETITARSLLPPEVVLAKLEQLEAAGLVRVAAKSNRYDTRSVLPTPALRGHGDDILDRLYYAFTQALNRP